MTNVNIVVFVKYSYIGISISNPLSPSQTPIKMIKKITLLFALLAMNFVANAQYSYVKQTCNNMNPGNLNQDLEILSLVGQGWDVLTAGSSVPVWTAPYTIPFGFNFNGNTYTSYKVSTTGILTFDVAAVNVPDSNNVALPSSQIPNNSICIWGITGRPDSSFDSIAVKTFGVSPNRQHWIWFASFSRPGITTGYTYWAIVLEESTNNIYIVDQRTNPSGSLSLSLGVQIDSTHATQVAGSPSVASSVITTTTALYDPSDNQYYQFNTSLRGYDVRPKTFSLKGAFPYKGLINGPFAVSGAMTNLGSQNITSMILNYSVDGAAPVSTLPLTVTFQAGRCYNYTHTTPWTPTSTGWHYIKLWASDLNGNQDEDHSNDTIYAKVYAYDAVPTKHTVVLEEQTGTWCGWCPRGTVYMDSIAHVQPNNTVVISVHGGYPQEPMRVPNYDDSLGILNSSAPWLFVNRIFQDDPSEVFNLYNAHINDFGLGDIAVSVNYSSVASSSTVSAAITSAVSIDGDYRVACVYTEDGVTGTGNGSNSYVWDYDQENYYSIAWNNANGYTPPGPLAGAGHNWAASGNPVNATLMVYDYVARKIQGDYLGAPGSLPATLTAGTTYNYTFPAYTIPVSYNASKMKAHVLLIDAANGIILNGASMPVVTTGVSDPSKGHYALSVFPNPAQNLLNVDLNFKDSEKATLVISDILGKTCYAQDLGSLISGTHRIPVDISKLPSGTYFITLIGTNGKATSKFVK